MNKFWAFCFLLAGVMIAAPAAAAADIPGKIGVIDIQKIVREAEAAKNARAVFQKERDARQATLEAKVREVRAIEDQLKKAGQAAAAKLKEDLSREVKEFNRLKSDLEEELKKKDLQLMQKIVGEIKQVVQGLIQSEGYAVVVEKGAVFASSGAIDITDKVIRLYDARKK